MSDLTEEQKILLEYNWLESVAASEYGVDSPFYSQFGDLIDLLSTQIERREKARQQLKEIEYHRIPVEGTSWVRLEANHPDEEVITIYMDSESEATEGISCAILVTLSNSLQRLKKNFVDPEKKIFEIGPKIGASFWAASIIAAANYARHKDEWLEMSSKLKSPNNLQSPNVKVLTDAGVADPWSGNVSLLEVVTCLQVNQWDSLITNLTEWLSACLPFHPSYNSKGNSSCNDENL
ncbi:MAG: hypothetical protein HUU56_10835 [Bdellovibrionaceae bacterium]|nr:hypothetical protein [Pseudobdellovibrionaceae bacterium]